MIPILYPVNLLAPPSVVFAVTTAGFPFSRLSDGDSGLLWKDSGTGDRDIQIDQGATGTQVVDTVILAAGHTLAGVAVSLQSGPTTGTLVNRLTFTAAAGVQRQTFPARFDRYWRVFLASTSVIPAIPELVLSQGIPFPSPPILRGQEVGQRSNVIDLESYGGAEWNLVRGPVRWTATYPCVAMSAADRDALLAAHRALDGGARACYLTDGEGVTRWVNWADRQLRLTSTLPDRYDLALSFREVLGAA